MDYGNWITIGVVVVTAVGQVMYFKGQFTEKIMTNAKDIKDLEENLEKHKGEVRYKDTCEVKHVEVDRRLARLETVANGHLKAQA